MKAGKFGYSSHSDYSVAVSDRYRSKSLEGYVTSLDILQGFLVDVRCLRQNSSQHQMLQSKHPMMRGFARNVWDIELFVELDPVLS